MTLRRGRIAKLLLVVVAAAGLAWLASRPVTLRAVGSLLVAEDSIRTADVIVIGLDSSEFGVLEAADLVAQGVASEVIVLADPVSGPTLEFARRGVPYEDGPTRHVRLLRLLGVPRADLLRLSEGGTEQSARALATWTAARGPQTIVVVTGADHSRRFRRVLRRTMRASPTRVLVRAARYGPFRPDGWWLTREGTRVAIVELQKLLLDFVRHPLS